MMGRPMIFIVLLALFFVSSVGKSRDLYKVLGVDRNANQRDIQKAFHRLSLQYHPDKNKNKGAQEKFAEINNAYEILSDEEKRKNYDLYGDEKGTPGFDGGGYTYFTGGGGDFTSRRNGWQMGGHQNPHSFSFSFGGNPTGGGGSTFDFGFGDLFSSIFGANSKSESQFGGSRQSLLDVDSQTFTKEIVDQGLTWLLLFYSPKIKGYGTFESVVHDISLSLKGAIKAGRVNCQEEQSLCSNLGIWPSKVVRFFVYSYKTAEKGELVEYGEELDPKKLMAFCHDQLPRFSTRHSSSGIEFFLTSKEKLPQLLLLSAKKETPVIWRVLSGLYRKRFKFHDAQVFDIVDERVKRFKVNALPAIVGRLLNGEEHVLKEGIALKDLNSGIREMKVLLNKFEQLSMKTPHSEAQCDVGLPYLTSSNMETICGESIPLCIIGVFRSTKGKKNLELILSQISQKTLTRRRSQPHASRDSISFCMLDAAKQREFLQSFDDSARRSSDDILLAYKPRKGKFSLLQTSRLTFEEAEGFVGSALNGDITFSKIQRKPILQ